MKKTAAALFLLCLLLSACGKSTAESPVPELLTPAGINIDTAAVTRGDLSVTRVYTGSLLPESTELSFPVSGRIDKLCYYPGQTIEAGEVIMTLDQENLTKQIESLQETIDDLKTEGSFSDRIADLEIAYRQATLEQYESRPDFDTGTRDLLIISVQEAQLQKRQNADNRNIRLQAYEEQLQELQERLTEAQLRAPVSGTVYYSSGLAEGSYVQMDKTICYVIDPTALVFGLGEYVSYSDLTRYPYTLKINGKVWENEPVEIDTDTIRELTSSGAKVFSTFRLLGTEEELASLAAGDTGALTIETVHLTDVLRIPANAVYTDDGGSYVYVVSETGDRKKRYFTPGINDGTVYCVTAGLEEGEIVYVQN